MIDSNKIKTFTAHRAGSLPAYAILTCIRHTSRIGTRKKMSCQRNAGKITVPDELRDILLEFTISYLLEQPVDIIDYAIGFFTQLRDSRQTQLIPTTAQTCSSTPEESVDEGERASERASDRATERANFHSGCDQRLPIVSSRRLVRPCDATCPP